MEVRYTASATSTGDAVAHVRSSDGVIDLGHALPKEVGGPGGHFTNPEQLFAAGWSTCFHNALKMVAHKKNVALAGTEVTVHAGIGSNGKGGFQLQATIEATMPHIDEATARGLLEAAEQVCPYSNATRGNIDVAIKLA